MRRCIAVGRTASYKLGIVSNIVELSPEASQIVTVSRRLLFPPVDLPQTLGKVECHFGLRGVERESRVPRPAIRPVKTAAIGTDINKRRVHNLPIGHAENQFVHRDARQQIRFPQQPFVSRSFELEQILQMSLIAAQSDETTLAALAVARGNQAVSVILSKLNRARNDYSPPRRASKS